MVKCPTYEHKQAYHPDEWQFFVDNFPLVPEKDRTHKFGHGWFEWKDSIIESMSTDKLIEAASLLAVYGNWATSSHNVGEKVAAQLKQRNVTARQFRQRTRGIELKLLGPEIAHVIDAYNLTLQNKEDRVSSAWSEVRQLQHIGRKRFENNNAKLEELNKGRANPANLEHILELDSEPIAIAFDEVGDLYIMQKESKLSVYREDTKIAEWKINFAHSINQGFDRFIEEFSQKPSLCVSNNMIVITDGNATVYSIQKPDLPHGAIQNYKIKKIQDKHIRIHDVLTINGKVYLSVSKGDKNQPNIHQIISIGLRDNIIYERRFPTSLFMNPMDDMTMRLGVFEGNLYFPSDHLLAGIDSHEQTKKYLEHLKTSKSRSNPLHPCSKFAFGENFLVVQAIFDDFETTPMQAIFEPNYKDTTLPQKLTENQLPERFNLLHIAYPQSPSMDVNCNAVYAAHGKRFIQTGPNSKEVYIFNIK